MGQRIKSRTGIDGRCMNQARTEFTPLTPAEQKFITAYIRTSDGVTAVKEAGFICKKGKEKDVASNLLKQPNVRAEVHRIMQELEKESIATAKEVMEYFTGVMRGEVKDQFGLDAPLSERTRAAQEIARRTVDIENRKAGEPDNIIQIKLDWSR